MPTYKIQATRIHVYEVEVEADDEYEAREDVRNWDIEDFENSEVDAIWDFDVIAERIKQPN